MEQCFPTVHHIDYLIRHGGNLSNEKLFIEPVALMNIVENSLYVRKNYWISTP